MQTLAELTAQLSQALHHAEVAELVIERGMRAFSADTCTLYILDERDGFLELIGERGCPPAVVEQIRRIPRSSDNPSMRSLCSGWGSSSHGASPRRSGSSSRRSRNRAPQALRRAQQLSREQETRRAAEQARSSLAMTLRSIGDAVMVTRALCRCRDH